MKRRRRPPDGRFVSQCGPPCPRCGRGTEVYEHGAVPETGSYFTRWYKCGYRDCPTVRRGIEKSRQGQCAGAESSSEFIQASKF